MNKVVIRMSSQSLADRDLRIMKMEELIKNKQKFLVKKKKELDEKCMLNQYLETVKDNYSKYYDNMIKEKQNQYDALLILKEYLSELIKSEHLVNDELRIAKHDEKDILREIEKVKAEIDDLL
jgi:hypothetical protein